MPALQDHTKNWRVIGYLQNTVQLPFVSGIDSNGIREGDVLWSTKGITVSFV